jgi:S-DNA-T family DNA segregation ATPase FtsK/SpoIIIE
MATNHKRAYTKTQKNKSGKSSSKSSVHKRKKKQGEVNSLYYDEITLVISLVVSLLLILSNFKLSGKVGDFINSFTFGMIGFLAYVLPFVLFFGVAFFIANRGNKAARTKLISVIVLSILLTSLIQLITYVYDPSVKILDYYTISAQGKNGGGMIGGIICAIFYPLFGNVGTYIVLIASIIVCIMFITGKALLTYLGIRSEASIQNLKEKRQQRMEEEPQEKDRRPAKIFTFKNHNKEDKEDNKDAIEVEPKKPEGIFGSKKKLKDTATLAKDISEGSIDSSFDMEEIKPKDLNNIPIYRGNSYHEESTSAKHNSASEHGLSKHENGNEDSFVARNHQDLDADIKKLLQAAGQNAELELGEAIDNTKSADIERTTVKLQGDSNLHTDNLHGNGNDKAKSTGDEPLSINQHLEEKKAYLFPPLDLLNRPKTDGKGMTDRDLKDTALKLQKTLDSFGVKVTITNVSCGPAVTRYELQPEQGVKVSKITGLADDIKLNLAAADVRIEAPIPGKAAVGIEVPNKDNTMVTFRELIESVEFKKHSSDIAFAVGKDIGGQTIVTDIAKMPHLLIAGATGSGKSVCINTLLMSILYKAKPSDVRLIMVDPKVVELSVYNGIPHLLIPVVTDPKKASAALNWAVMEMTERYKKFADLGVRDIKGYNEKVATVEEYHDENYQKLPQIVIIVDELADLMMVAPGEVEDAICRLAQMARAAGLHLIIATQRPSVNVITGLIKANIPSRIAFSVSSAIDSRTIIDGSGAEKLLGKGDMLFFPSGYPKPVRVQGAFVSDKEVSAVVEYVKTQNAAAEYSEDVAQKITSAQVLDNSTSAAANDRDEYFIEAGKFIIEKDKASIGMLQRVYKIGFNRAARIMDQLSDAGVVGPEEGTKPRKVLMSLEEFEQYVDEYV